MGKDGMTASPLSNGKSKDDVVRANDAGYVGLAERY